MIDGLATRAVKDTGLPLASSPALKRVTDGGR